MKVFFITFDSGWLGGYAVVVANNKRMAKRVLKERLMSEPDPAAPSKIWKNDQKEWDVEELDTESKPAVLVFYNGDY